MIPPKTKERASLRKRRGETVRRLRQAQKKSRMEFAAQCGIHLGTLINVERGRTSSSLETFERIAKGLGVPVAAVLGGA